MTQPIYAIGDIHGQKALLDHALALIEADGGHDARVVFLGDYIDRGPDSQDQLIDRPFAQATTQYIEPQFFGPLLANPR